MDNAINSQIDLAKIQASQPSATERNTKGMSKTEIRETAESFESMVMSQFVGQMFTDIDTDGPFSGGKGEEIFRSLMIDEYSKGITQNGGVGIADMVEKQLLQYQETQKF
jgi:flagellar protein FlgJ